MSLDVPKPATQSQEFHLLNGANAIAYKQGKTLFTLTPLRALLRLVNLSSQHLEQHFPTTAASMESTSRNSTMLNDFRQRYPLGSITTELLQIEQGIYLVRSQILVQGTILGSGIAGSTTVEDAEDASIQRALRVAGFESVTTSAVTSLAPVPPPPALTLPNKPAPNWPEPKGGDVPNLTMATEPEDFSDLIAKTDVEMKRVGWNAADGRRYLKSAFSKTSRHELSDSELQIFLQHLKQLPTRMLVESDSNF